MNGFSGCNFPLLNGCGCIESESSSHMFFGITEQNIYPLFNVLPLPLGFASTYSSQARAFMVSASAFS